MRLHERRVGGRRQLPAATPSSAATSAPTVSSAPAQQASAFVASVRCPLRSVNAARASAGAGRDIRPPRSSPRALPALDARGRGRATAARRRRAGAPPPSPCSGCSNSFGSVKARSIAGRPSIVALTKRPWIAVCIGTGQPSLRGPEVARARAGRRRRAGRRPRRCCTAAAAGCRAGFRSSSCLLRSRRRHGSGPFRRALAHSPWSVRAGPWPSPASTPGMPVGTRAPLRRRSHTS